MNSGSVLSIAFGHVISDILRLAGCEGGCRLPADLLLRPVAHATLHQR